jgi:hypothetical protein
MTEHGDNYLVEFQVLTFGLIYASVCTSLGEQETTERLNLTHPTGLSWGWTPSTDARFVTGQPNPCKCEIQPDTHEHRLYTC